MHRISCVITGIVLAAAFAGCSEGPPPTGTVEFKGTNSPAIDALRENMAKTVQSGAHTKKSVEPPKTDAKEASK